VARPKGEVTDPLEGVLERHAVTFQQIAAAEVPRLQKKWRESFAHKVMEKTGEAVHLGFDWHAFSYEFAYALYGDAAVEAYRSESAPRFFALPNLGTGNAYKCEAARLPDLRGSLRDVYIVAPDYSWTMVFTHEEMGPYFTRKDWSSRPSRSEERRERRRKKRRGRK
jgi:Domain of unknown function (DUF4275)